MERKLYTVNDIVDKAVVHYGLDSSKKSKKTIRESVVRKLREIGIWNQHVEQPKGKKEIHYFEEETMWNLIYVSMKSYFLKRAGDEYKLAQKMNEAYYEDLSNQSYEDDDSDYIYKYDERLDRIMLRALFDKFFSLDEEKLKRDFLVVQHAEPGEFTADEAAAYSRCRDFKAISENYITSKRD